MHTEAGFCHYHPDGPLGVLIKVVYGDAPQQPPTPRSTPLAFDIPKKMVPLPYN